MPTTADEGSARIYLMDQFFTFTFTKWVQWLLLNSVWFTKNKSFLFLLLLLWKQQSTRVLDLITYTCLNLLLLASSSITAVSHSINLTPRCCTLVAGSNSSQCTWTHYSSWWDHWMRCYSAIHWQAMGKLGHTHSGMRNGQSCTARHNPNFGPICKRSNSLLIVNILLKSYL